MSVLKQFEQVSSVEELNDQAIIFNAEEPLAEGYTQEQIA